MEQCENGEERCTWLRKILIPLTESVQPLFWCELGNFKSVFISCEPNPSVLFMSVQEREIDSAWSKTSCTFERRIPCVEPGSFTLCLQLNCSHKEWCSSAPAGSPRAKTCWDSRSVTLRPFLAEGLTETQQKRAANKVAQLKAYTTNPVEPSLLNPFPDWSFDLVLQAGNHQGSEHSESFWLKPNRCQ